MAVQGLPWGLLRWSHGTQPLHYYSSGTLKEHILSLFHDALTCAHQLFLVRHAAPSESRALNQWCLAQRQPWWVT
jgi:hypothetical protein